MTFFTNNIAIRIDYENLIILITGQGNIIKNEQCKVHYIFKETTLVGYTHLQCHTVCENFECDEALKE